MSPQPLDEVYFDWLFDQVGSVPNTRHTYRRMLERLFFKEFVWFIPNDDNRAEDGRDLRREFVRERGIRGVDPDWMALGCSMLELFIGIARRLEFEAEELGDAREWFWVLINNLGLDLYPDNPYFSAEPINEILDDMIWRTYRRNGRGGLFPLRRAQEDQRDVEIWYQLSAYLLERAA